MANLKRYSVFTKLCLANSRNNPTRSDRVDWDELKKQKPVNNTLGDQSPVEKEVPKSRKKKKGDILSSDESFAPEVKKKKKQQTLSKRKKISESDVSSSSTTDSDFFSSDNESSDDSEAVEKAGLCYDITDFKLGDLSDLPDHWDKGFEKLRSYVPLTLFKTLLLESYYHDEKEQKLKDESDLS